MAKRKKRKFDTEGLVEQMFAWIPEGPVGVQLALRGVIRSIELRGIPTSRLAPVPRQLKRVPLVKPISEGLRKEISEQEGKEIPPYLPVPLYEIHLSLTEDPKWRIRVVARKFGEAILLLAKFPEVERLRKRIVQKDRKTRSRKRDRGTMAGLLRTFAKRWLENGSNRDELAGLLRQLATKDAKGSYRIVLSQ